MMGRYSLIMYALRAHASPASAYCPSDETAYSFDPPDIKDKFNIRKGSVFEWVAVGVQTELERNDAERPGVPQTGSKTKLEIGSTEIAEAGDCRYETISITRKNERGVTALKYNPALKMAVSSKTEFNDQEFKTFRYRILEEVVVKFEPIQLFAQ